MTCLTKDSKTLLILLVLMALIGEMVVARSAEKEKVKREEKEKEKEKLTFKSQNDERTYKYITLDNKLRLMLVSDPTSEKAAAAVSINAGYSNDPDAVPGIAHFCEHMLFLGTKKYPVESEFSQFLSKHGGRTNAYTSAEYTTYFFDIIAENLSPALDRFAEFFISPRFDKTATERELHAIDQEHQKNILDDSRRIYYMERASAKPGHAYGNFGTGNLETLKTTPIKNRISIRKKLLEFHQKYYSANIMTVAVVGKESLEDLEKLTVPLFKEVNNTGVELPSYKENLAYGPNELQMMLKIPTIREMNRLEVKFQIHDLSDFYKSKPAEYLSQVIGHEGKGSLLSLLKKKGWAHSLWAGDRPGLKGFEFFVITLDLTSDGLGHVDDIIGSIFEYIKMLKQSGPKQWIFDEMKNMDETHFRFKGKEYPANYVQILVKNMFKFKEEDVLNGRYQHERFKPEEITDILDKFTPSNLRYLIASQIVKGPFNKTLKYFNAAYSSEKIPLNKTKKWMDIVSHDSFHLPRRNPFIPENLDIVVKRVDVEVKGVPTLIKDNELSRVWYKADDTFFVPKSSVKIKIYSQLSSTTPSNLNHLSVFIRLVREAIAEYGYDARLAGISYTFRWLLSGILIGIDGFSGKQDELLEKVIQHITNLDIIQTNFDLAKQKLLESLQNMAVRVPYAQTEDMRNYVMSENMWNSEERLKYMSDLTVDSLQTYISAFLKDIYIESLFCGNVLESKALRMHDYVENMLRERNHARPMLPMQHLLTKEYILPPGNNYLYEKRSKIHSFSAIQIYLQVGLQNVRNNVLCELFWHMISSRIFATLRTKEQLGYIVFGGLSRSHSVQGIRIQVQSDREPSYVGKRIDNFLSNYEETLNAISEKELRDYVEASVVRKLEKPKQIGYEANIYSMEIYSKQYNFRRGENEVKELRNLNKQDVIDFYKQYIDPASKLRKRMAIVVLGQKAASLNQNTEAGKEWIPISDVLAFKQSLPLYGQILPYGDNTLLSSEKVSNGGPE